MPSVMKCFQMLSLKNSFVTILDMHEPWLYGPRALSSRTTCIYVSETDNRVAGSLTAIVNLPQLKPKHFAWNNCLVYHICTGICVLPSLSRAY